MFSYTVLAPLIGRKLWGCDAHPYFHVLHQERPSRQQTKTKWCQAHIVLLLLIVSGEVDQGKH